MFVGIPFISIVHWLIFVKANIAEENYLKAWTFTYPLSGMCLMMIYLLLHEEMDYAFDTFEREAKWETSLDKTINTFEDVEGTEEIKN